MGPGGTKHPGPGADEQVANIIANSKTKHGVLMVLGPEDAGGLGRRLVEVCLLKGDFLLSSGRRSNYYFDKYLFETRPELLRDVTRELLRLVPEGTELLAGPELGAIPLVTGMGLQGEIPFTIVRKEPKDYGTARHFEGRIVPGQLVVLVEDVVTTGTQALKAARLLQEFGVKLDVCLCVLDREEGGTESFAEMGLELQPLFTSSSLGLSR